MMDLNKSTAAMLRIGIYAGLAVIIVGLISSMVGGSDDILYAGVLILIVSPFLGIVVSFAALIVEKDWKWAVVAAILLAITIAGAALSI